jgi:VanZ family protein
MGSGVVRQNRHDSRPHYGFVLWAPVVAFMAIIFYVSSLHQAPLPPGMSDKAGHSLGYIGLGLLMTRAVAGGFPRRVTWRQAVIAIALTTAYGATDEFHQRFVAGRSAELADLYADAAGACIAAAVSRACGIIALRSDV